MKSSIRGRKRKKKRSKSGQLDSTPKGPIAGSYIENHRSRSDQRITTAEIPVYTYIHIYIHKLARDIYFICRGADMTDH